MAFKIIFVIAAAIACCAHAKPGGPAAYSISAPSADHESVGNTQEHTVKGHYGQSSQSDYSSQVQTAHSQSHVQRSSTSNDAGYAPHYGGGHVVAAAPVAHAYAAAPAVAHYAAPAATYAQSYAPALSHGYAHSAPALVAHSAPAISIGHASHGYSYAAPAISHGYSAPDYSYAAPAAIAHQSYAAPALHYAAAAPAISHYAAPAAAVSHSYVASAPATVKIAAAPAYAAAGYYGHGGYAAHGLGGYAAHGLGYAAPAPAYAAHYAAPVVKAVAAAPALVHTSVSGHGVHYGY